jgi:hypothetical protein
MILNLKYIPDEQKQRFELRGGLEENLKSKERNLLYSLSRLVTWVGRGKKIVLRL